MQFVEGFEILDDLARTGSFTEERARGVFRQIVSAVEYLHSKNVCHRDIKPSNILVTEDLQRVVLVDFNVASDKELMYTRQAGTLAFAAPEQLLDNKSYTHQVDMWSCGILLFMLLSGQHPFEWDGSATRLVNQIVDGESQVKD